MKKIIKKFLRQHNLTQSEQEQLTYMPQSVKLEEAVNPHMIRITMIVISSAIFLFFIWAAFTKINEVTRATGEVVPRGYTQVIQHLEGALVKEILIRDGDIVDKDQILIKLEDSSATQELAEKKQKYKSILTQIERNRAFLEQRKLDLSNVSGITKKDILFQNKAYAQMQNSINKERDVLSDQVAQKESEIKKIEHRLNHLKEELKLTSEARDIQQKLLDKGYASRIAYIKFQQEHHKTASQLQETQELHAQSMSALSEYKMRLASLQMTHKDEVYTELGNLQSAAEQMKESIIRLEDRVNRLTIQSPVHGIIKGLKLNTIGGVVEPGKPLLEVVPLSSKLIVEAQVLPKDIGHIKIGQTIRVKVSSFDFARYGTVDGTLEQVSATTFLNEKKEPYYKVRIELSKTHVGNSSNMNNILPGMIVVGDIITGEKTILSYLFKPIHLSFKTAFTER